MYRLIALLLILVPGSLVHETAITDLPEFTAIHVCFLFTPGLTLCEGPTKAQLLANNFSFNLSGHPIPIHGGLSGPDGDLGHGDDFLVVGIPRRASLDSVSLVFGGSANTTFEYADRITLASAAFAPGSSLGDLSRVLGPTNGSVVEILNGSFVFGFASSAPVITPPPELPLEPAPESPVPVPEPATLTLLAVGSVVLKVATRKSRSLRT
jgi:hypothetical protein